MYICVTPHPTPSLNPMLCPACKAFTTDFSNIKDNGSVELNYDRRDRLPDLPILRGLEWCKMCFLLRHTLLEACNWDAGEIRLHNARFLTEGSNETDGFDTTDHGIYELKIQASSSTQRGLGETIELSFGVYADEGTTAWKGGEVQRRLPSVDVLSSRNLSLIKNWIECCIQSHPQCQLGNETTLPTRVIDIGAVEGENTNPRLVITEGTEGVYIALSHCWGPNVQSKHKTELASFDSRCRNISPDELPQNFQDAIIATRALGLRYIWIDSLCIIQDSPSDWEKEAALMDKVYKNALLTLAATSASACEDGFLDRSAFQRKQQVDIPFHQEGVITIRQETGVEKFLYWDDGIERSRWNARGWTLQERFLSRRVLHFTSEKLFFECKTEHQAEDHQLNVHLPFGPQVDSPMDLSTQGISTAVTNMAERAYKWWYRIVSQYSPRALTVPSDKLPAIAGLAIEMSRMVPKDMYYAGLWKNDLHYGLLWKHPAAASPVARTQYYRAPSWSWAALDGRVVWPPERRLRSLQNVLRVLEGRITPQSALNPWGCISQGYLRVSAKLIQLSSLDAAVPEPDDAIAETDFGYDLFLDSDVIGIGELDSNDGDLGVRSIYCLQVIKQFPGQAMDEYWSGLLLEKAEGIGEFRRVGVFVLLEDYRDLFDGYDMQEVTLV